MSFHDPLVGPLLVGRHLAAVLASAALLLLHISLGGWIVRRWFGWNASPLARWVVQAVIGLGAFGTLLLVLAVVGILHPAVVLAVTVVAAVLVRRECVAELQAARTLLRSVTTNERPARLATLLVLVVLLALVIIAIGPPTDWDSLMYHLRVPQQFLDAGRLIVPRDNFHVALVNVAQFATLPLVALGLFNGPALMQVGAAALVLAGTFALARAAGLRSTAAWAAVFIVLGSPIIALVAVTARVDVTLVLALIAAHLVLLSIHEQKRTASFVLVGVLLGIAVAIKPQAGAYAVALAPMLFVASGARIKISAIAVLTAVAVFLPWALKNYLLVGAVFYPMGAPGWFQPWLADLYGARAIPASVDQSVLRVLPSSREAFNLVTTFLNPASITIETEGRWYTPSWAFLLLPLVVLKLRTHQRALGVALVGVAHVVLVTVPFGQINLRYLMPALPALAVGVAVVVQDALEHWTSRRRHLLLAAALCVTVLGSVAALAERLGNSAVLLRYAAGVVPAREVFRRHPDVSVTLLAAPLDAVSRIVPDSGLVLLIHESRGLAFNRPVLADVLLSNWSFASQSPAAELCLAGSGITHILVNLRSRQFYINRGASPVMLRQQELQEFRDRCVQRIPFDDGTAQLWELRS